MSRQLLTVLSLRRRAAEDAIRDLVAKQALSTECRRVADAAGQDARRPVEGDDAGAFITAHDLSTRRHIDHQVALTRAAEADASTAEAMTFYTYARRQVEMIERLLEKKAGLAHERAMKVEQSQLDDASAALWSRSHA